MRLLRWMIPLLLVALAACVPTKKSVFPPAVSIQQLVVQPDGQWQLTLRIQNNSYAGMTFSTLDGRLQLAELVPVRVHAGFERDIPALAGDTVTLTLLPTPEMGAALAATAAKGSAGTLAYRLSGTATATPEEAKKPRDFDFSGNDWLSPVPGLAGTFR